jgi:hypothetical protein
MASIFPDAQLEIIPTLPFVFLHPQRIGEIYGRFLESVRPQGHASTDL